MEKKWNIRVIADVNDGDYIEATSSLNEEEVLLARKLFNQIKQFLPYEVVVNGFTWKHHHNYPNGEYSPREDLGEKFVREIYNFSDTELEFLDNIVPYGEYGVHTIVRVELSIQTPIEILL